MLTENLEHELHVWMCVWQQKEMFSYRSWHLLQEKLPVSRASNFGSRTVPATDFSMGHESLAIYRWSDNVLHMLAFHLLLFICPVMSDSLWPHGLQHARPTCPSSSPGDCPHSCSLHQWCHPAISSSDTLFSFCPWSFPASGTFPMSHLFASDDQNTGTSASANSPSSEYSGLISLKIDWFDVLAAQGTSHVEMDISGHSSPL